MEEGYWGVRSGGFPIGRPIVGSLLGEGGYWGALWRGVACGGVHSVPPYSVPIRSGLGAGIGHPTPPPSPRRAGQVGGVP